MSPFLLLAVALALLTYAESCGKTLTGSGRLTSPGYPMSYPPNVRCKYTLRVQGTEVCAVELKFEELDVDGQAPKCDAGDAVFLPSTRERFCGVEPPPALVLPVSAGGLQMEFYSNGHGSGSGFALRLSQIENSCPKKVATASFGAGMELTELPTLTEQQACFFKEKQGSSCGGDFSKEQFRVEGPSTPGGACLYVVRKFDPAVCKLQVRFQRFSLGADGACSRPRLLIAGRSLCGSRKADDVETFDFPSQTLAFLYQPGDKQQNDKFALDIFQETCS